MATMARILSVLLLQVDAARLPETVDSNSPTVHSPTVPECWRSGVEFRAVTTAKNCEEFCRDQSMVCKDGWQSNGDCAPTSGRQGCNFKGEWLRLSLLRSHRICHCVDNSGLGNEKMPWGDATDAPPEGFRFFSVGDFGDSFKDDKPSEGTKNVVAAMAQRYQDVETKHAFVLGLGDNFYDYGLREMKDQPKRFANWVEYYGSIGGASPLPWYNVLGNHDWAWAGPGGLSPLSYAPGMPKYDLNIVKYQSTEGLREGQKKCTGTDKQCASLEKAVNIWNLEMTKRSTPTPQPCNPIADDPEDCGPWYSRTLTVDGGRKMHFIHFNTEFSDSSQTRWLQDQLEQANEQQHDYLFVVGHDPVAGTAAHPAKPWVEELFMNEYDSEGHCTKAGWLAHYRVTAYINGHSHSSEVLRIDHNCPDPQRPDKPGFEWRTYAITNGAAMKGDSGSIEIWENLARLDWKWMSERTQQLLKSKMNGEPVDVFKMAKDKPVHPDCDADARGQFLEVVQEDSKAIVFSLFCAHKTTNEPIRTWTGRHSQLRSEALKTGVQLVDHF